MKIILERDVFLPRATLSRLFVVYDGAYYYDGRNWLPAEGERLPLLFGCACEDKDRGLVQDAPLAETKKRKKKAETAIPSGTYRVEITFSNRFQKDMPLVCDVPAFAGIRIHPGNDAGDTEGCILPGLYRDEAAGTVSKSDRAFLWLFARIRECAARGERVSLVVSRTPPVQEVA